MRLAAFCVSLISISLNLCAAEQVPALSYSASVTSANNKAHQGQLVEALTELNAAIASNPEEPRAYRVRGNVLFAQKSYRAALRDFDRLVQLKPQEAVSYLDRAIIYLALDEHAKALDDVDKALELQPNSREALFLKLNVIESHARDKKNFARVRAKGEKLRN